MDYHCKYYCRAAKELGLPTKVQPEFYGFSIKLGRHLYFFRKSFTPFNLESSIEIGQNKHCHSSLLQSADLPVPDFFSISKNNLNSNDLDLSKVGFPVVAKPTLDSAHGDDVICNIPDEQTLRDTLKELFNNHLFVTVEKFIPNTITYRVLVFYNQVIALVRRYPASVIGDGTHSIEELMNIQNIEREKINETHGTKLGKLEINDDYQMQLNALGLTTEDIPKDGEEIRLNNVCNAKYGGHFETLPTSSLCRDNQRIMIEAAKVLNLNFVGFDIVCDDISIPFEKSRGYIIESNYTPDITLHDSPMCGNPRPVSKIIMRQLVRQHPWLALYAKIKQKLGY